MARLVSDEEDDAREVVSESGRYYYAGEDADRVVVFMSEEHLVDIERRWYAATPSEVKALIAALRGCRAALTPPAAP